MVRSFGLLLLIGVGIAFLLALTAGFAALSLRRKNPGDKALPRAGGIGGGAENGDPVPARRPLPPMTGPARRSASCP